LIPFIDLKTQFRALEPQIRERIDRVLTHGQFVMGPEIDELEEKLAAFVGVRHCISASSGTDTLLMAMMALDVGAGDEVITTPFTFVSTGEMIALLGAKPVFVDIDARTYNIDPARIEKSITPRTKAIMPVSLFGQTADMDAINEIAARRGLPVIEDAAQSFGATYRGRRSCGLSTIGSTSFFPSKPLGAYGDGGAIFTNDDQIALAIREIRSHGQTRRYHHTRLGINGRLDTIQAAVLLAKLERFEWEIERRLQVASDYSVRLTDRCSVVKVPYIEPHATSVFGQFTIEVADRAAVMERLSSAGIPVSVHYPTPLHLQPAFRDLGYEVGDFPVAEAASKSVMSLPMSPDLSEGDLEHIVEGICVALQRSEMQNA